MGSCTVRKYPEQHPSRNNSQPIQIIQAKNRGPVISGHRCDGQEENRLIYSLWKKGFWCLGFRFSCGGFDFVVLIPV